MKNKWQNIEKEVKEMKMLDRDNLPCWYELSWREEEPAIVLRVHKDFVRNTRVVPNEAPIVTRLKEEFGFKDFVGSFDGDFGFDKAFTRSDEIEEFVEFLVKIPVIKQESGKKCSYCKGSGHDNILDTECIHCSGTSKEYIYDWQPAYAVSASFTLFSRLSAYPKKETSSSLLQLLTVETVTQKDFHGGSLYGMFSIPFCEWLDSFEEHTTINEGIQAMKIAFGRMIGLTEFDEHRFKALVSGYGTLHLDCPGDACGIYPSRSYTEEERGYEFSCHNVDTPLQQITLIAGLAALHDKARKEMA